MKIKREFCGQTVEIELTEQEMDDVYEAVRLGITAENLSNYLDDEYYEIDEALLNKMAEDCQKYMSDGWNSVQAMEITIRKKKDSLAYYRKDNAIGFCG